VTRSTRGSSSRLRRQTPQSTVGGKLDAERRHLLQVTQQHHQRLRDCDSWIRRLNIQLFKIDVLQQCVVQWRLWDEYLHLCALLEPDQLSVVITGVWENIINSSINAADDMQREWRPVVSERICRLSAALCRNNGSQMFPIDAIIRTLEKLNAEHGESQPDFVVSVLLDAGCDLNVIASAYAAYLQRSLDGQHQRLKLLVFWSVYHLLRAHQRSLRFSAHNRRGTAATGGIRKQVVLDLVNKCKTELQTLRDAERQTLWDRFHQLEMELFRV
jgi:hypothetical protein